MSWDGFLPEGVTCKRCGKELSDKNGRNPAESYLGSYTGLCKECTYEDPYVVKEYFDGAKKISHPPIKISGHNPRREFVAYDDCDECDGKGCEENHRVHRTNYYSYCEKCNEKFHSHPLRERKQELLEKYEQPINRRLDRWEEDFQDDIEDIEDDEKVEEIAEDYLEKINEDKNKLWDIIHEKFDEAKEFDNTDEGIEHLETVVDEIEELNLHKDYSDLWG